LNENEGNKNETTEKPKHKFGNFVKNQLSGKGKFGEKTE
jgi:hypothetical protein